MIPNIIDASSIIDALEANTLENLFHEISDRKDTIWITPDVYKELNNKLDDGQRIQFENLVKQGIKEGYIVHSRHKYRLKMPYKNLPQDLRMFRVNLQRTDRNLIGLMYQIRGRILTNDEGIKKALRLLITKNTPWRKYAIMDLPLTEDFVEHNKNFEKS